VNKNPDQKKTEAIEVMLGLLGDYKTASLATRSSTGEPQVSYSPAAVDENKNFYFFLSELSEHTGNLQKNPQISLMLIEDESRCNQLFARNRLTVNGRASVISREHQEWSSASAVYRARFGKFFDQLSQLKDFHMFKVVPEKARLVVGFGAAYEVMLPDWRALQLITSK
jgi:heme oxygenase (biliverdin-IX-beta and delta-forming)